MKIFYSTCLENTYQPLYSEVYDGVYDQLIFIFDEQEMQNFDESSLLGNFLPLELLKRKEASNYSAQA